MVSTLAVPSHLRREVDYSKLFPGLIRVELSDLDFSKENVIVENGKSHVFRYSTRYAVSTSRPHAQKEIEFMLLAGQLSIEPVGYLLYNDVLDGYMMPLAKSLKNVSPSPSDRQKYMREMKGLIESLHYDKNIIHGDVKLSNFLLCSDGKVRLCDFEESQKIGMETTPFKATEKYRPPWRVKYVYRSEATQAVTDEIKLPEVLSVDDDYYGLGLAIWELFTGRDIFEDLDGYEAERDYIVKGYVPDASEAGDADAINMIWKFLEIGGRGIIDRTSSPVYKVTGPPIESLSLQQRLLPHHLRQKLFKSDSGDVLQHLDKEKRALSRETTKYGMSLVLLPYSHRAWVSAESG